jgi:hypothetical protein
MIRDANCSLGPLVSREAQAAQFVQFHEEPMPQWAFGSEVIEEGLRFLDCLCRDIRFAAKKLPKTTLNLSFC